MVEDEKEAKRSNLVVERGVSEKVHCRNLWSPPSWTERERERVNDGPCLISRRILGARGVVESGSRGTICDDNDYPKAAR